jgi:hypothetical protein
MTAREELYNKLSAEYAAFIGRLEGLTPQKIIDAAYESVFKADILMCFEYGDGFSERQIAALLALEAPLDELYRNWLDTDASYMDDLSDSISDFAVREIERQNDDIGAGIAKSEESEVSAVFEPQPATARAINGKLKVGDTVIIAPDDDYGCLVGRVIATGKRGTPEHDGTENESDGVHVDFTAFSYPPWQMTAFAEYFNDRFGYDEYMEFDELPLDDVIIAPDAVISLTGIGEEKVSELMTDYDAAERFCNLVLQEFGMSRKEQLIGRAERNHSEHSTALLSEIRKPPKAAQEPPKQTKKKRSITARLQEAGAEAKAYNAQRAQKPKNQSKSKNTRGERS